MKLAHFNDLISEPEAKKVAPSLPMMDTLQLIQNNLVADYEVQDRQFPKYEEFFENSVGDKGIITRVVQMQPEASLKLTG